MSYASSLILRRALLADAVVSGASGLLLLLGASVLTGLLGLPETLLRYAGLSLLPFAALVGYLGLQQQVSRAAVLGVIAYNALWTVDSFLLLASGWVAPTALGHAFVAAQALAVGGFAALQWLGLRRSLAGVT